MSRVQESSREGTSQVKRNASGKRVVVSADGEGVVSHAGLGMLRELAEGAGLVSGLNAALADTYRGPWVHARGGC